MASSASSASCHPDCDRAMKAQEDYDASQSAALVAAELISGARLIHKLDTELTPYSAQFLVDNACPKKEDGQRSVLTVKDALAFALKEGIPKEGLWPRLGCLVPPSPSSASYIPRVSLKRKVAEANDLLGLINLLLHRQPVGGKLHVWSPEIDSLVDKNFRAPPGYESRYVGLRDVIIVAVRMIEGEIAATVKIWYKKKTALINVSFSKMHVFPQCIGDTIHVIGPTTLLVDFCVPFLSIK
ncbi:PREDICTED: uncharacterized protein LOC104730304 [Camelina sativa]|uniref:Uncharacterized protein LOC104730304 n=1 Tax=Camelina sativa TaxID=90675 RepID=A0ABM0UXF8_CAMSA|nr:PREDICTED: uncharacterized protein LOC104730304 [Camelina sativa]